MIDFILRLNGYGMVVPKLQELGVIINDLYTIVAAHRKDYLKEDRLHLSDEGIRVCDEQVCNHIRAAAKLVEEGQTVSQTDTTIVW